MNRISVYSILGACLVAFCSLARASSSEEAAPEKPTLRIEEAMRVWQERWAVVSGAGQQVGLKNPNFGRNGTSPDGIFAKPLSWPTRQDGTVPSAYPGECFYREDLTRPNIAASYVIALRNAIQSCLSATVAPTSTDTGGVILRFDPNWANTNLPWAHPDGPYRAPDASRMFRVFYNNAWVVPDINVAPWNTLIGGSITIDNFESRFLDLVTFLKLPFAVNTHGTQVQALAPIVVAFTHDFFHPDIYRQSCDSCAACASCRAGTVAAGSENLSFSIGLGTGANGSIGSLFLYAETPNASLATPAALDVSFSANVVGRTNATLDNDGEARIITSRQNGINMPRQIYLPGGLVDIIVETPTRYILRVYDAPNRGNLSNGLYVPIGTPHSTVRVENPDGASSVNRLKITANNGRERSYLYAFNPANSAWRLEAGEGAEKRIEITSESWVVGNGSAVGDEMLQVSETRDSNDQPVSVVHKKFKVFHWNATSSGTPLSSRGRRHELIEEVVDPTGRALTTTFRYDESTGGTYLANQSKRRLKQVERPDGSWERYDYDTSGRVSSIYTPVDSSASIPAFTEAPTGNYRLVTHAYVTNPYVRTTVETVRMGAIDYVVGRRWLSKIYSDSYEDTIEEQATEPGAILGSPTNLKTISRRIMQGQHAGKLDRLVNPDGTVTLCAYSYDSATGRTTSVVRTGVPVTTTQPIAATDVSSGTRTTTVTNAQGQEVSRQTVDVVSNLVIDDAVTLSFDSHGRPLLRGFPDGTTEQTVYGCCGVDSFTNRTGLRTAYTYDIERRVIREIVTQASSSEKYSETEYTYDTKGRLRKTIANQAFAGIDATVPAKITTEERQYNSAGELILTLTPLGTTSYSQALVNGRRVATTTFADGTTRIERYNRAGQLEDISGSAASPVRYEYGADVEGAYTLEIRQNSAPNQEAEWVKTYRDFAGRPSVTVLADSVRTTQSYYAADDSVPARRGKLKSVLQPADSLTSGATGVQTLIDYNSLGEVEITALDLNKNGVIDYTGTDRISKTVVAYAQVTYGGTTYIVRRSTTSVWSTESSDVSSVVTISEQSVDGRGSWTTNLGTLTTGSVLVYNGNGVTTRTVTQPDSTVITTNSIGERTQYTTHVNAGTQLKRMDYAYDGYGRIEKVTDAAHGITVSTTNGSTIYTYFDSGLPKSVTTPDPDAGRSGPGYDIQKTQYFYDGMGRQTSVTHPDNSQTYYRYDSRGQLYRTWGSRTYPQEMTYDQQGRLRTLATWRDFVDESSFLTTGGKSVTTWNYHPQRGWLDSKVYHDSSVIAYQYYPSGKLRTRTWARGVVTSYTYNAAGELLGISYSDSTPAVSEFTYDRLGRRTQSSDAAGTTTTTYQGLTALPLTEVITSGPLAGVASTRGYDSLYRATSLSVPAASYSHSLTFRDGSRLNTLTSTLQGTTTTHTYTYLTKSELPASLTQKLGATTVLTTARTYDRLNRLVSITSTPSASSALSTTYGFNSANQRVLATEANGDNWNYGYDSLGQVTSAAKKTSAAAAIPGHTMGYAFDTIGNRTQATRGTETSSYLLNSNGLNQYAQRTIPALHDIVGSADTAADVRVNQILATRQGATFSRQISVDNSSVPVWKPIDIVASLSTGEVVKETGNLFVPKSPEPFTHDADGNLTDDGRWTYTWDAENRLIAQEIKSPAATAGAPHQKLEYGYDGGSRRIFKKVYTWNGSSFAIVSSKLYVYSGWNMLAELNALSSNTPIRTFVWGSDLSGSSEGAGGVGGLLAIATNGNTFAPTYDGNGNVTALVNFANGLQQASYAYGPFGELTTKHGVSANDNPFQFSTKYTDSETDLVYYGFRYCNPSTGRWLNRDPLVETGGYNLYGLTNNNPVNFWDQLGLLPDSSDPYASLLDATGADVALAYGFYDEYRKSRIEGASSVGIVVAISVTASYEDALRQSYNAADKKLVAQVRDLVSEGLVSESEGAKMRVEMRNKLALQIRDRSSAYGRTLAELMKPADSMKTYEQLRLKNTDAEILAKAPNATVNRATMLVKRGANCLIVVGLVVAGTEVYIAPPGERYRTAVGQFGGFAGGMAAGLAGGRVGEKAGRPFGPYGPPVGAFVVGVPSAFIGGWIADQMARDLFDLIVE